MKAKFVRVLAVIVVLSMIIPAATWAEPAQPEKNQPTVVSPGGVGAQADPMSKLDSELRTLATEGGKEAVTVYIYAKEGADLSRVAKVLERRPLAFGGELVVAEVLPAKIGKMASSPEVMAAEAFHAIEAPIPLTPKEDRQKITRDTVKEMRQKALDAFKAGPEGATKREIPARKTENAPAKPETPAAPEDWWGVWDIGAPDAWDKGFTGDGVNIAIVDSGVDFGHPDLQNSWAYYDDEDSPYYHWPIALDPRSMREYYYNGNTSSDNYSDWWDYSWYADVYNVLHCTRGQEATFEFVPDPYDSGTSYTYHVASEITSKSLSGEIRWGIHPDEQLYDFVWNGWVPFILLDPHEPGVYDTVIADLNFDFWFDHFDDAAMLGSPDPVLNQDLGSYLMEDTVVPTGTQYVPASWFWAGGPPTWYYALNGYAYDVTTAEVELDAGTWIAAFDHNADPDGLDGADGVADVSGGMVYFIADGKRPVPAMDYLYPGAGPAGMPPIPFNGQLVAFMIGSYWAGGGEHGTLCASAAVAQGNIKGNYAATGEWVQYFPEDWSDFPFSMPWLKEPDEGTVQGPAPEARIIAIGDSYEVVNDMQGMYDAYTFLAYGVDGEPNSGDEVADIVSMSYGDGTVHNDGWDWESRLLSYYNQQFLPETTLVDSAGNGGEGYGTVNSPGSNTSLGVGASTQYGASTVFGSGLYYDQINDGDVQPFSNRGPDATGGPDPDVVANGAWGAGDVPLNLAPGYGAGSSWFVQDGNNAWEEWGGTSRSSPEAAGVMALVYDAYRQAHGGDSPTFETAQEILMSGADDLKHDVLMQGAGRVNADRATDLAGNRDGVWVSPSSLQAGDYHGDRYEAFTNLLFPGDEWTQTFTVHNANPSTPASVSVGDEFLMEMPGETRTCDVEVKPYTGNEDSTSAAYYYYANYFACADPSLEYHGQDMVITPPMGADLMQVELLVPMELQDFSYVDPNPYSLDYQQSQRWSLTVYDWYNWDFFPGDNWLWQDANMDGIVNPLAASDDLQISSIPPYSWPVTEINRYAYSYNYGNHQEVTVRLGDERADDQMIIGIVHRNNNDTRPGWGAAEYAAHPLQVKITFFQKVDWPLVSESPTGLTVPAGGSATFDATFDIPSDQPPGLYEGAITLMMAYDEAEGQPTLPPPEGQLSLIPTTVNVAVPSDQLLFTLGGTEPAGTPYDNGRMDGGWTWYNGHTFEQGDWRFFYYDANAGFDQQYLYVRDQWGDLCCSMPTFNETLVWGPNPGDQFSLIEPEKYGPYGMQFQGGTPYATYFDPYWPDWGFPRLGYWWQGADGPLPESRAWATLADGLNMVQFRNVLLSGKQVDRKNSEGKRVDGNAFEGTAGVFGVDAPETGLTINTEADSGSFSLDAVSPVDGLIAYATGFGQEQWFRNQDVPQGKHPGDKWPDDLMAGWVHTFDVTNSAGIMIDTTGPWTSDMDLYLLYDANGDGLFNPYDNRERVGMSDDWASFEHIDYWGDFNHGFSVKDGTYAVVMYGAYLTPQDQFDLHLQVFGGDDLSIAGSTPDNNYVLDVTPGETESLTVNWQVPGPGVWSGYMWFAMPWEEEPQNWYQGPWIGVPVTINFLGVIPTVTKTVDKPLVCNNNGILTYLITVANEGGEDADVTVADLLPDGVNYYQQWIDDPDDPGNGQMYVAKWWYANGANGYLSPVNDSILWDGPVGPSISGRLYIEYKVKVKPGYWGSILNKADVTMDYGGQTVADKGREGGYHVHLSATAHSQVYACTYYLPIIGKGIPITPPFAQPSNGQP